MFRANATIYRGKEVSFYDKFHGKFNFQLSGTMFLVNDPTYDRVSGLICIYRVFVSNK